MPIKTNQRETRQEAKARAMFLGVLGPWASDCLRLRASGLDRPSRRGGSLGGAAQSEGRGGCVGSQIEQKPRLARTG